MRTARYLYLIALATLALPAAAAAACLLNDYSVRAEYDRSLMVITGKVVVERVVAEFGPHYDGTVYSIAVDEVYRGDAGPSLEVFSENSSGRFPMHPSEPYLLFVSLDVDRLTVDNCGNSGRVSERAEVLRTVTTISRQHGGQTP